MFILEVELLDQMSQNNAYNTAATSAKTIQALTTKLQELFAPFEFLFLLINASFGYSSI